MVDKKFIEQNKEYPLVLIGDAVSDWKKNYHGPIVEVSDIKELHEAIAYYSGITRLDRPVVISDVSLVGDEANSALLKFIEDSPLQIVLLSRYDKLDSVLLSRVKRVEKYYKTNTDSMFLRCSVGQEKINDQLSEDSHYYDKVRYMGKYSPKLLQVEKIIKVSRIKNKILTFID